MITSGLIIFADLAPFQRGMSRAGGTGASEQAAKKLKTGSEPEKGSVRETFFPDCFNIESHSRAKKVFVIVATTSTVFDCVMGLKRSPNLMVVCYSRSKLSKKEDCAARNLKLSERIPGLRQSGPAFCVALRAYNMEGSF
jgi:hypothetical protein